MAGGHILLQQFREFRRRRLSQKKTITCLRPFFTQLSAGNQYLPSPIQCRTPPCLALMLDTSVRRPSSILSGRLSRILYWTSICPIIFHTTIELMPTRKCSTLTSLDHAKYVEERNFYFCGLFGTNSLSGIWLLHVYTTLPYLALSL